MAGMACSKYLQRPLPVAVDAVLCSSAQRFPAAMNIELENGLSIFSVSEGKIVRKGTETVIHIPV
jgi:hypothetical protein